MRIAIAGVLLLARTAFANLDADTAARLYQHGRELAQQQRYEEASRSFARSLELEPAVGTELSLADCLELLGRVQEALTLFEKAAAALDSSGDRANGSPTTGRR